MTQREDAAAARAAEQARLRKQRREAKIKAGGASRLEKITGLGGGIQRDPPPQPTSSVESTPSNPIPTTIPTTSPNANASADPEEVDISQHYYKPQSTARPPPNNGPSNVSEAQLRRMMLGFDSPTPAGTGTPPAGAANPFFDRLSPMSGDGMDQDPMMQMLQKMMAGGMPGGEAGNPFAGMGGLDGLFGGGPNPMQQGQQQPQQSNNANLWRILHAIFALGLGIYVAFSTTFTGTKVERDTTGELRTTGLLGAQDLEQTRAWFFYIFTSVEAVLLTSRYMSERSAGFTPSGWVWTISGMLPGQAKNYARHALRYTQILATVRNDALFCIFVMGICSLLRS
ncbi:hypothetical protein F5Y17DRAFT_435256 [Xylariaceae sp. FL0594]|nr:hypothetical protein F5Y17DRAFT_435256 [Xylariaceae sp. FL0594]